jgi:uncharacterized protein
MESFSAYALLACIGVMAGVLNTIAGGGSFLTLPLLIFLGLPAAVANGTNRLAVIGQSLTALSGFQRWGRLEWRFACMAAMPAVTGSLLGAWGAVVIGDEVFKKVLSTFMMAVTIGTFWIPVSNTDSGRSIQPVRYRAIHVLLFLLVGLYGGFIQAGVGFFILAVTAFSGFDVIQGNGVKVFTVLLLTLVSLIFFAWNGKVDWPAGLVLSAGTAAGGALGARLSIYIGETWVKRVVTALILIFAVLLWGED